MAIDCRTRPVITADPSLPGPVAQLVEQRPFKPLVAGSNPAGLTPSSSVADQRFSCLATPRSYVLDFPREGENMGSDRFNRVVTLCANGSCGPSACRHRVLVAIRIMRSLVVGFCLATTLASCGEGGDGLAKGCATVLSSSKRWTGHAALFAPAPQTTLMGNQRIFFWSANLGNLCVAAPESGNLVRYEVDVEPGAPEFTIVGKVFHAVFAQPYKATLTKNASTYLGTVGNVGLEQGSVDGKSASVNMELSIAFPTQGSLSADSAYAEGFIDNVFIFWDFQSL